MFGTASNIISTKLIDAMNKHVEDIKPNVQQALSEATTMRSELIDRVDRFVPKIMDEVQGMRQNVTDRVTEVTDQVTEILGMVKDTIASTKKTSTIVSQIMEVVCSISSIVTFAGDHTILHGISALWSIWKVIKICLDIFPAIKDMDIWKETANANMDELVDESLVSSFRSQSGNTLLTGLGFAAVITKFMPSWVVKTLDIFSKNTRYRVLEDLSWLGDAVGIILEIPSFIINWVADNFSAILRQSQIIQTALDRNFDVPMWGKFNDYLESLDIPTKLREYAEVYQSIICRLPGTRLHRVARAAEQFIQRAIEDYRILSEQSVFKELKGLTTELDLLIGNTVKEQGRIPENIRDTYRKLQDLYRVSLSMASQIRQVPVWIVLQGPPGCGKSYILSQTLTQLGKRNGVYYYVNNNPQKDYNDLYMGQAIWAHDELGRRGGFDYSHYVDHVSVMPSPLDAAELTRKQLLTFQSKLILSSTNDDVLNKRISFKATDMIQHPNAIYRRMLVIDCSHFKYDSVSDTYIPAQGCDGQMHCYKYNYDQRAQRYEECATLDPNSLGQFIEFINAQVHEKQLQYEMAIKKSEMAQNLDIKDFNKLTAQGRTLGDFQTMHRIEHWFNEVKNVAWDISLEELFEGSWSDKFINGISVTKDMLKHTVGGWITRYGQIYASNTANEYIAYMKNKVGEISDQVLSALRVTFDSISNLWNGVWDKYVEPKPIIHQYKINERVHPEFVFVRFLMATGAQYASDAEDLSIKGKSIVLRAPIGISIKNLIPRVEELWSTKYNEKVEIFVNPMMYNYKTVAGCDAITINISVEGNGLKKLWKWFVNSFISHPVVLGSVLLSLATMGVWYLIRSYGVKEYKQFSKVNFPRAPAPHQKYRLRPQNGGEKLGAISDNTLRATISTNGQIVNGTIVMLDSLHAMIPAHCIVNADHSICETPYIAGENRHGQQMFKHKFELLDLNLMEDYAILKVAESTAHIFKDIKKRFVQEIQSVHCVLVAGNRIVNINTPSYADINAPYFTFRSGAQQIVTELDKGFQYDYEEDGICGALVCTTEGQILGWHVATDDTYGYARAFKPKLLSTIAGMVEVQQTIGVVNSSFAGALPIKSTGYRAIQKKSRIAPSKAQQHMEEFGLTVNGEPERVPARIDEPGVDAFKRGQEKNLVPGKPVDREALEFATQYMKQMLETVTKGNKLDILSEREIVCGRMKNTKTTMSTLRRVEPKSSAGIPWSKLNGEMLDYENGTINREVKAKMDWIEKNARSGIRVENEIIFKDCWKDELRVAEKRFKPRIFAAGPLHYTLLLRKYFGHLCELFMNSRLETGVMIGINALSREWDVLCKKLVSLPNIFSGDYKSWDGAMVKEFQIELNNLMASHTEYPKMTEVLLSYLYETQREGKDTAYLTTHSIPSGHGLTALYNSLINKMYIAYAWYLCVGKDLKLSITQKIIQFRKDVYAIVYGDDVLVTVADCIKNKFNAVSYAAVMDSIGLGFTTAMKEVVTLPFERLEDVTFLKRTFIYNKKVRCTTGPLEPYILRSTIGWVNDPTLDEFLIKAKMDNIQRECFLNPAGDHLWTQMCGLFRKTYGYDYDGLSEAEMIDLFNRGELESDYELMNYT